MSLGLLLFEKERDDQLGTPHAKLFTFLGDVSVSGVASPAA